MSHGIILPVVLPLLTALALVLIPRLRWQRRLSMSTAGALVVIAAGLFISVLDGERWIYALGAWSPPFGIVLVLDRLSALMVLLTAVLAAPVLVHASSGADGLTRHFHAFYQLQLMGLNGAFLTGDLFNLFVFFEILLIASYGLLLHGSGPARARAGIHYVIINLAGSSLFLIALGVLYGLCGTLNMADLAHQVAQGDESRQALVHAGIWLLIVVFTLKAALAPLHLWLPGAYNAAHPAVAALFAIMTKVGVYALLRVMTLVYGFEPDWAPPPWPALMALALATLLMGAVGVMATPLLRRLVAYLVIISIGTLIAGVALASEVGIAAALYYLIHTTLVSAGLFLLADLIGQQRGADSDRLLAGAPVAQPGLLGALFLVAAVTVVGLPPLSGFLGKVMVLQAAADAPSAAWVWGLVLGSGLLATIALSRAGSALFWHTVTRVPGGPAFSWPRLLPAVALIAAGPALAIGGGPLHEYTLATARQVLDARGYVSAVLGDAAGGA